MFPPEFYQWVMNSPLGQFMANSSTAFSLCETIHFIGLCLLMGALLIVDLRLLGMMKSTPVRVALQFLPIAIVGFTINLLTGICFYSFNPQSYTDNWMFWVKSACIVLAGLNAVYFTFVEQPKVLRTPEGESFDMQTKVTAALSLALWIGVMVAGRLLPVTQGELGTG